MRGVTEDTVVEAASALDHTQRTLYATQMDAVRVAVSKAFALQRGTYKRHIISGLLETEAFPILPVDHPHVLVALLIFIGAIQNGLVESRDTTRDAEDLAASYAGRIFRAEEGDSG